MGWQEVRSFDAVALSPKSHGTCVLLCSHFSRSCSDSGSPCWYLTWYLDALEHRWTPCMVTPGASTTTMRLSKKKKKMGAGASPWSMTSWKVLSLSHMNNPFLLWKFPGLIIEMIVSELLWVSGSRMEVICSCLCQLPNSRLPPHRHADRRGF